MATNDKAKKEYGIEDMVRDFTSPSEYKSASDLCEMGNLRVKTCKLTTSDEYGESYAVTFEDDNGKVFLSYISAKQPFTVIKEIEDAFIDCVVVFNKITTKDKKTIVKMVCVEPSDRLNEYLNKNL